MSGQMNGPLGGPLGGPPSGRQPAGSIPPDPIGAAIRHERLGEMAATLGRLTRALGAALQRLERARERLQAEGTEQSEEAAQRWQLRHAQACEALWNVMIQRELCGMRRHGDFLREHAVPPSVRLLMGPASLATPAPLPATSPDEISAQEHPARPDTV